MNIQKLLFATTLAFAFVGCATLEIGNSRLATLEGEATLDKMDSVQGIAAQDGNHASRCEVLAGQEILNRKVQAEKNKGLRVEMANYVQYARSFEVRKASIFLTNPITASFLLPADTVKIFYLMPGFYEVKCFGGKNCDATGDRSVDGLIWKKIYEVTSAPAYDEISGEETHCTMGSIDGYRRHHKLAIAKNLEKKD
jgi:hypothetical protein